MNRGVLSGLAPRPTLDARAFRPLGLPGAPKEIASGRFCGGVPISGQAPTIGYWRQGDYLVDAARSSLWICNASGNPGTWTETAAVITASAANEAIIRANSLDQFVAAAAPVPVTAAALATPGSLYLATMVNLAEWKGLGLAVDSNTVSTDTATATLTVLRNLKALGFPADVSVTFTTPNDAAWDGNILVELEAEVAGHATVAGVWGLMDLSPPSVSVAANGQTKHGGGTTTGLLTTGTYDNIVLTGGGLVSAVADGQFATITDGTNSEHISYHGAQAAGVTNVAVNSIFGTQPWTPNHNYTATVTLAAIWGRMPQCSVIGQTAVARRSTFVPISGLAYNTTYSFCWGAACGASGTVKTYAGMQSNVPSATPYGPMKMRVLVGT